MFPGKQVGVTVPDSQLAPERGPERTVLHAVVGEMVAVQYSDEQGRVRSAVLFKAGDRYYMPPNAEQWAGSLRECSDWLTRGVEAKVVSQKSSEAPKQDSVDVIAADIAAGGQ